MFQVRMHSGNQKHYVLMHFLHVVNLIGRLVGLSIDVIAVIVKRIVNLLNVSVVKFGL